MFFGALKKEKIQVFNMNSTYQSYLRVVNIFDEFDKFVQGDLMIKRQTKIK